MGAQNKKELAERKALAEKIQAEYDRQQREIKMQLETQAAALQRSKEAADAAKMQWEEAKKQREEDREAMKKMVEMQVQRTKEAVEAAKMQMEEAKKQEMKEKILLDGTYTCYSSTWKSREIGWKWVIQGDKIKDVTQYGVDYVGKCIRRDGNTLVYKTYWNGVWTLSVDDDNTVIKGMNPDGYKVMYKRIG